MTGDSRSSAGLREGARKSPLRSGNRKRHEGMIQKGFSLFPSSPRKRRPSKITRGSGWPRDSCFAGMSRKIYENPDCHRRIASAGQRHGAHPRSGRARERGTGCGDRVSDAGSILHTAAAHLSGNPSGASACERSGAKARARAVRYDPHRHRRRARSCYAPHLPEARIAVYHQFPYALSGLSGWAAAAG